MKSVLAILALAAATSAAFASEATQFEDAPGTLTRAEVRAAIGTPSTVTQAGDAVEFKDPVQTPTQRTEMMARVAQRQYVHLMHEHGR